MEIYGSQKRGGSHPLSSSDLNGGSGAADWAIARYGNTDSQTSIPGSNVIQITPPSDNVLTGGRRRRRSMNRSKRNKNMKRGGGDDMDGGRDHMKRNDMGRNDMGRNDMGRNDMDGGRDHMRRGGGDMGMDGGRDHMKRDDMDGGRDHMRRGGGNMGMDDENMGMDEGVDMSENMETEDTGMGGGTGCNAVNGGRKSGGRGVFTNVAVPALLLYANNTFRRRKTMTKSRKSKKNKKSTKTKKSRRGKR